ncbi:Zn-ribbon domain-containing OB-fold protein [Actinomadura scrupuli]|uniref:Zn-ribbon domain-containing OB-fold protein n=1 Tax=Actinomadura scrupuli TaxID=559629 RepID=UPI003D98E386
MGAHPDLGVLRRDGRTDAFFDGAAADRLMIRRCEACSRWSAPDTSTCPGCGGEEPAWARSSGQATLVTWTITHGRPREDGTVPEPVVLALVELDEGPWLHTRLDGAGDLHEGMPLRARFGHPPEGEAYLFFGPA